jgi:hypothetical protein
VFYRKPDKPLRGEYSWHEFKYVDGGIKDAISNHGSNYVWSDWPAAMKFAILKDQNRLPSDELDAADFVFWGIVDIEPSDIEGSPHTDVWALGPYSKPNCALQVYRGLICDSSEQLSNGPK